MRELEEELKAIARIVIAVFLLCILGYAALTHHVTPGKTQLMNAHVSTVKTQCVWCLTDGNK